MHIYKQIEKMLNLIFYLRCLKYLGKFRCKSKPVSQKKFGLWLYRKIWVSPI